MKLFNKIELFSELTFFCNWKCSYCCQNVDHNDTNLISAKTYKLLLYKFLSEVKKENIPNIEITLMGGELSTNKEFLKHFEITFELLHKFNINADSILIVFSTNFSGNFDFFNELMDINNNYPTINFCMNISIHEEYYQQEEKILKFIEKVNKIKNMIIDIQFLESKNPKFINCFNLFKKHFDKLNKKINIISTPLIQKGLAKENNCGIDISKKINSRLCDVLTYSIMNNKIIDRCKNKEYNFGNFKIDKTLYKCDKICPCSYMPDEFNQLPIISDKE
jgi:hypothetical protein